MTGTARGGERCRPEDDFWCRCREKREGAGIEAWWRNSEVQLAALKDARRIARPPPPLGAPDRRLPVLRSHVIEQQRHFSSQRTDAVVPGIGTTLYDDQQQARGELRRCAALALPTPQVRTGQDCGRNFDLESRVTAGAQSLGARVLPALNAPARNAAQSPDCRQQRRFQLIEQRQQLILGPSAPRANTRLIAARPRQGLTTEIEPARTASVNRQKGHGTGPWRPPSSLVAQRFYRLGRLEKCMPGETVASAR